MPERSEQFKHIPLRLTKSDFARPGRPPQQSARSNANRGDAGGHGGRLKSSISSIISDWKATFEKRQQEGMPDIPNLPSFLLQLDSKSFDADTLKGFGIEVILELENGVLTKYTGNYSDYLSKKALLQENEAIELDKTKKLFRKELDWVRRQPKARTTKAKSRVDKFEEIKEQVSGRHRDEEMKIEIKPARLGTKIIEAHNVSKAFGNHVLLRTFNYKFKKGERVGIVGPNGAGKSTFLKLLTGGLEPDSGKIVIGDNTVFGYYSQDGMKLAEDKRVIDVITDIAEYIPLEKGKHL
jgi:ABC-type multidrug transport system fused ATPase/permease subunit